MGRIGDIYCMNLFKFLENWHPNTSIMVETNDNTIFEGIAGEVPLEISCKYWVQEGMVRNAEDKMIIPVEHEDEINRRLEERKSVSFYDILQNIVNDTEIADSIKEAFDSMIRSANRYCNYRKNWNRFPIESLGQRNKERTMSHDVFITDINSLAGLIEETTSNGLVPWREALGNDRHILGDFAEYIINRIENFNGRLERLEAIKWAQEHQSQIYYLVDHSKNNSDAKTQLMQQYNFADSQAQAIIDMRVRAFSMEEKNKVSEELQGCIDWLKCFPEL